MRKRKKVGGGGGVNYTKASRVLIIKFSKTWEREKSQKESEKKRHIKLRGTKITEVFQEKQYKWKDSGTWFQYLMLVNQQKR